MKHFLTTFIFSILGAQAAPHALPIPSLSPRAFTPKATSIKELGVATDTLLNRDSCGSAKLGDRTLWTCRDTQFVQSDGLPELALFSSSASWVDDKVDCSADLPSNTLRMYGDQTGKSYFPFPPTACSTDEAGSCGDGSRSAIWPDSPPLVTSAQDGTITAYTWIRQFRINKDLTPSEPDPATALYSITSTPSSDPNLPPATLVDANFYAPNELSYGNYGSVLRDGYAYLYAQPSNKSVYLARVPPADIPNRSKYEYFVSGTWTRTRPSPSTPGAALPNAGAGGQGTFYFSEAWQRFVWIGQAGASVAADFHITTAEKAEGPWEKPEVFYQGQAGGYELGAYSLQAHPDLVGTGCNAVVVSWTKNDLVQGRNVYSTPLVRVTWE